MGFYIPSVNHSVAPAKGVAAASPISVPSINAGAKVLAVIVTTPVADVDGLDPSDFVVVQGEIESATVDTAGKNLFIIHTG